MTAAEQPEQEPGRVWVGLGDGQEVPAGRLQVAEDRFDTEVAYAVKSQTHLWVIFVTHKATEGTLDAFDGQDGTPLLDADTLLGRPEVGCYVCEERYDPRLRRRRCAGEPRRGGRR